MPSIHRSIFFSAIERYGSLLIFLVSTAILSRLLTPAEFGTYAVINALTAVVAASFQEFGGANYLIQKRELTAESIRTAFTITFGISILIAAVLLALSDALAWFFKQDGLKGGIAVSALNFLMAPLSSVMIALSRRDMEFGKLAVCNLAAVATGAATSVFLAILGFSYMAPIWGTVAGNAVLAVLLLAWRRDITMLRPSLRDCRDVMGFGLYSSGVSVINVFYNLAPQLFLARILDFGSVGLYSRAINITQMFDKLVMQVLNPIIMPAIVNQRKTGADMKGVYIDAIRMLSAVQWPFLVFVAVMARPIVLIWLGQNWLEIVPLVRLLCIANLAVFAASLSYPMLVVVGSVRDALTSSLISLPPSLLVILGASFFGVEAVASSALLTLPFQAAVAMYFIGRHLAIGPRDILGALLKSSIVTILTSAGAAGCAALIETGVVTPVVGLIFAFGTSAVCWWLGMAVTGHPLLARLHFAAGNLGVPRLRPSRWTV
jgi:O-antigen/teichoic acid export membrane protein